MNVEKCNKLIAKRKHVANNIPLRISGFVST